VLPLPTSNYDFQVIMFKNSVQYSKHVIPPPPSFQDQMLMVGILSPTTIAIDFTFKHLSSYPYDL
jgi:hypothetical protein